MRLLGGSRLLRFRAWHRRKASTESRAVEEGPEPPNGFLFNEKPLLPGEKRVKEWWENLWVYGMGFNMLLLMLVGIFKPDTSVSTWARARAEERFGARAIDSGDGTAGGVTGNSGEKTPHRD